MFGEHFFSKEWKKTSWKRGLCSNKIHFDYIYTTIKYQNICKRLLLITYKLRESKNCMHKMHDGIIYQHQKGH